jgi:hypothetical protein
LGIDISNVDVGDKAIIDAGILRINEEEDVFYANVFGKKKNKDEGEIENDYNDDEDCENRIRMDDANIYIYIYIYIYRLGFRSVATDLYCYN